MKIKTTKNILMLLLVFSTLTVSAVAKEYIFHATAEEQDPINFMSNDLLKPLQTVAFTDNFDIFNTTMWGYEYSPPTISGGYARFTLTANQKPNQASTWSKISSKNTFSYGTYTTKLRFSGMGPMGMSPTIWSGFALINDAGDEINWGFSPMNTNNGQQIYMETYLSNGQSTSVKVDTGVNLYDGNWHTGKLIYTSSKVSLYIDGALVKTITTTVPTSSMQIISGARVIAGQLTSPFYMDFDSLSFDPPTGTTTSTPTPTPTKTPYRRHRSSR